MLCLQQNQSANGPIDDVAPINYPLGKHPAKVQLLASSP